MNLEHHQIGAAAAWLADRLPYSVLISVAGAVAQYGGMDGPIAHQAILQNLPTPDFRDATAEFLDLWRAGAASVGADAVAVALMTAAQSKASHRSGQVIELVWTGPESGTSPFRRTEQAILQVLDSATRRIILVSYAVYKVPRIAEALVRAAARGVRIAIIIESPDRLEGQNTYSTLKALGEEVAACSTVYLWPPGKRKQATDGRVGILHVKCAVADGRMMFLSSANLTEYAFSLNMELGLLVTGGDVPARIEAHFDRLIELGVFARP